MRGHHRHRGRRPRTRRRLDDGSWDVRARVERFFEPALLLLLRDRPRHGYELLELLPQVTAEDAVDVGNLYRALRALEEDGVVTSEWSADLPGPAKRTYTLTDEGRRLLDAWAAALGDVQGQLIEFLRRYDERR
jgi:poly-beta-hydroxybutyrate-responsive repressor